MAKRSSAASSGATNSRNELKRGTVRAVTNFEWTLIEKYIATRWPDVAGCPTGVAGAILAQDLVESLAHLRNCCRGNRPKAEHTLTLVGLIRRFNGALFALFDVLFKHGARGVLHDVNGPTGVRYAANQEPVGSYSEAVWVTGQVFYLHCLGETDSEAYQASFDRGGPSPQLDLKACFANWNQIAPCGYEILEPVTVLRLATEREVVKAHSNFKGITALTAGAGHLNHPSLQKRHGADKSDGQTDTRSQATEAKGDDGGKGKWFTANELDKLTGVNRGTIKRAADRGEIQTNGAEGDAKRYCFSSFHEWHKKRSNQDA